MTTGTTSGFAGGTADDRLRLLADAAGVLEAGGDLRAGLQRLADLLVERGIGASCTVFLISDGTATHVAQRHRDPALQPVLARLNRALPPDPSAPSGAGEALRTGEPQALRTGERRRARLGDDPRHAELLAAMPAGSAALVPMRTDRGVVGLIELTRDEDDDPFTRAHLPFLQVLARRAGAAVEAARIAEDAERAGAALDALVQAMPVGIALLDRDLRYERVNAALAALNGLPPEAHLGHRPDELFPGLPAHVIAELEWVRDGGEVLEKVETMPLPGDGALRELRATYVPVAPPDGPVTGVGVLIEDITDQRGRERERERVLVAERAARLELQDAHRRTSVLAEAGDLLAGDDVETALGGIAALLVREGLTDLVAVDLLEGTGWFRRLAATGRTPALHEDAQGAARASRIHIAGEHPIAVCAREQARVVRSIDEAAIDAMAASEEHREVLRRIPIRTGVCEPLVAHGRVVGVLSVGVLDGPALDESDPELLADLARRIALTVAGARERAEREAVAHQLQQALLPPRLPAVPGLEVAAAHVAGSATLDVGGDFYDLFEASPGVWTALVGDVCGKGAEAAVVTATARHATRTLALRRSDPSDLLARANDVLLRQDEGRLRFVTMVAARLLPSPGGVHVDLACGGHPPPLVARADGTAEVVAAVGPVLGLRAEPVYLATAVELGPGDALVLYTDGLTDPRGGGAEPPELAALAARALPGGAEAVTRALRDHVLAGGAPADDLAVLVLRAA